VTEHRPSPRQLEARRPANAFRSGTILGAYFIRDQQPYSYCSNAWIVGASKAPHETEDAPPAGGEFASRQSESAISSDAVMPAP
jgi:hypothetical protein